MEGGITYIQFKSICQSKPEIQKCPRIIASYNCKIITRRKIRIVASSPLVKFKQINTTTNQGS